jgi:hypothetical protein
MLLLAAHNRCFSLKCVRNMHSFNSAVAVIALSSTFRGQTFRGQDVSWTFRGQTFRGFVWFRVVSWTDGPDTFTIRAAKK